MSSDLQQLWQDLRNPQKYVRLPRREIFDEHEESYWVDKETGAPCAEHAPNAKKISRKFGKEELQRIADINNQRSKRGELTVLTFGHTDPKQKDETKQPAPRGYAMNYGVKYDASQDKYLLEADFYVRKNEYRDATTYPRTSIELWPGDWTLDPIALLRRTPARPLRSWHYHRVPSGREILRYAMDTAPGGPPMPELPPLPPEEEHVEHDEKDIPMPEKLDMYMKHCGSHKYHKAVSDHYGMGDSPMGGAGMGGGEEEEEMPIQASANAFPSATNAGLPGRSGKPSMNAKGSVRANTEAIQMARTNQQLQQQAEQLKELREAYAKSEAEKIVYRLTYEGYDLKDPDAEVLEFASKTPEERLKYEKWIRAHMEPSGPSQAPVQQYGRIGIPDPTPARGAGRTPTAEELEESPEAIPLEDQQAALQYQKKHRLYDLDIFELAARAVPAKAHLYRRTQVNGTNGTHK